MTPSTNRFGFSSSITIALAAAALPLLAQPARADDAPTKASTTLQLSPRKLDFAGSKDAGMMYFPSAAKLSDDKPAGITKEPAYRAKPKYSVLTLGNGSPNTFVLALDEPAGQDSKLYIDTNGNGDLTDDGNGAWDKKTDSAERGASYQATRLFKVHWKNAGGAETSGEYGLNFYHDALRDSVFYYRAGALTGSIKIDGKDYEVLLVENDNDALYNKPFDPKKALVVGEPMSKGVWLFLDNNQYDIRETFAFADVNFLATVSDDGTALSMKPTNKSIRIPRSTEHVPMLSAGGEAPDFDAVAWKGEVPGETFKLSDFRGKKIVVVDMWATWCGPCMKSIPHFSKLAAATKGQDVVFIALNVWDDKPAYEKFAQTKGKDYAFMLARDQTGRQIESSFAKRMYKVSGIPATFVIDKTGKIAAAISGYTEGDKAIEAALAKLGIKVD